MPAPDPDITFHVEAANVGPSRRDIPGGVTENLSEHADSRSPRPQ
jgi:hypothetical protein